MKGVAKRSGLNLVTYNRYAANNTYAYLCTDHAICVTRKSIVNHVWIKETIDLDNFRRLKNHYVIHPEIVRYVNDYREVFCNKNMRCLHLFGKRYICYPVTELATFANGLRKDKVSVENAVASPLSNGFDEGANSILKTLKR